MLRRSSCLSRRGECAGRIAEPSATHESASAAVYRPFASSPVLPGQAVSQPSSSGVSTKMSSLATFFKPKWMSRVRRVGGLPSAARLAQKASISSFEMDETLRYSCACCRVIPKSLSLRVAEPFFGRPRPCSFMSPRSNPSSFSASEASESWRSFVSACSEGKLESHWRRTATCGPCGA